MSASPAPAFAADVSALSYPEFVALLEEENRPSGGKASVREILQNAFVDSTARVLEVGCTNGFTSLEVARTARCRVVGIDVSERAVRNARRRARTDRGTASAEFFVASAYRLPFADGLFDVVICGNATSFMEHRGAALAEYTRVLRQWGFVAAVPIWYRRPPPATVRENVSAIIGARIESYGKSDWLDFFRSTGLELYYCADYAFDDQDERAVDAYVSTMLEKAHLRRLPDATRDAMRRRWAATVRAFSENLRYAAYSVVLLRRRGEPEEVELFSARPLPEG